MKLTKRVVYKEKDREIIAYHIKASEQFEVEVLNLGGIITKIMVADQKGKLENVVVGYKNIESYLDNPSYLGAIIGRTAGRICEGKVRIEDKEYVLDKNYGLHHGHGGYEGIHQKLWEVQEEYNQESIALHLKVRCNEGEGNYPGNLEITTTYRVYDNGVLEVSYHANTDATTLCNLTNHSYFNLSGDIKAPITQQELQIKSDSILELDHTCVPTGKKIEVKDSPFDFGKMKTIGRDIDASHGQLLIGRGYDHAFLLKPESVPAIVLQDTESKRRLEITTNQKAVVVYTMNYPDDELLYNDKKTQFRYGICFETQAPPIGREMCFLEDSILKHTEEYHHLTNYRFSTM